MKPRQLIAAVILIIPILFVLLWHISNRGLPTDDAANYAVTALQVARQFKQGILAGISAVFNIRGWRPTAFSAFSVPFLLLTGGNVVAACAATLISIYVALTFYSYRLARLFSTDSLMAAATTAAVVSMPVLITYSVVFYAELAWVLFSVACVYHLFRSGPFRNTTQSLVAGFYGGLMGAVRPAESVIVLFVLLAFLLVTEFRSKRLSIRSSVLAIGIYSIPALLLTISGWVPTITRSEIWMASIAAVAASIVLIRRLNPSFVAFWGALISLTCIWWGGFMASLLAWAHEASAYVTTARNPEVRSVHQIATKLLLQTRDYGEVQMAVVICLGILLLISAIFSVTGIAKEADSQDTDNQLPWVLLFSSGLMLLIFAALYAGAGSDRRRTLVALTLFSLSVFMIAGKRSRLLLMVIVGLVTVQFAVIGSALAGTPIWVAQNGFGIPEPHRAQDRNREAASMLAKYIPKGNELTVYTLALFSQQDRIYEPNALRLALLEGNYGIDSGYFWDSGPYDETLARLQRAGFGYLLLDSFSVVSPGASQEPYGHFATELLRRVKTGGSSTPELRLTAQFQLGKRDQMLFRILPNASASDYANLAAEWNGSKAVASEQQGGFPSSNLNDGTEAAWGSLEGKSDVYAGVVLPSPVAIHTMRLRLMTPQGRAHLREIRIVAADREDKSGSGWRFVRARLKGTKDFSNLLTVPPLPDNTVVEIELDPKDPQWSPHMIWGFACLRSRGDVPNYINVGSGVYVRELMVQ